MSHSSPPQQQRSVAAAAASAAASASSMPSTMIFEPAKLPAATLSGTAPQQWAGDLLVLAVSEDDFQNTNDIISINPSATALMALDYEFGKVLSEIIAEGGFEGKQGTQSKVVRVGSAPSAKARQVALVGVGKGGERLEVQEPASWGQSWAQALGSSIGTLAKSSKIKTVAVALVGSDSANLAAVAQQVITGALMSGYETTRFKSKPSPTATRLESLEILARGGAGAGGAAGGAAKGAAVASGAILARYLVESPPNFCTPTHLANAAQHIADRFPSVMSLEVLEKAECEKLGMGSFLGVAEASDEPPKFIHLTYKAPGGGGSGGKKKVLALVGKGLTFDSGGYNIKAGAGSMIEMMKFDMGGAAATLGAARIIAETCPPGVEVHFIVAACENMIAGRGLRPGDILTAANGKTIEVNNTDAEGRLTLADALWFAQEKCGATTVVDSATLTGACMVALGGEIAGLFTPSDKMADLVVKASRTAGEKVWRMPMEPNYWESMKSPIADMKNTGSRLGGSITAALFLEKYIKEGVEWAHIDMAGPVWDEKAGIPTGYGAATLAEFVMGQASS